MSKLFEDNLLDDDIDLDDDITTKSAKGSDDPSTSGLESEEPASTSSQTTKKSQKLSISGGAAAISTFMTTNVGFFFKNLWKKTKQFYYRHEDSMQVLLVYFIVAILSTLFYLIINQGTIPLGGDYNLQSMTFPSLTYDIWRDFFKTGQFPLYDHYQFLGVNNIGSNSFYMMFDPWYFVLIIFPKSWLLVLQGIGIPIKMVVTAFGTYKFFKYLGFKFNTSTICGIAYGFGGYMMFNLWFQFIDIMVIVPFIFLGIDKIIKENKIFTCIFSFTYVAFVNFFFFCILLLGGFFYAIFRLIQVHYKRDYKENTITLLLGFLAFFLPILISGVVLVPSLFNIMDMPRMEDSNFFDKFFKSGFKELIKNIFVFQVNGEFSLNTTMNPLYGLMFPPLGCFYQNLGAVPYFDNMGLNIFISTPLLLCLIVGIVYSFYEKKTSYIIATILVGLMIFTPFCYFLFSAFRVGYSRFLIFVQLLLLIMTAIGFEKLTFDIKNKNVFESKSFFKRISHSLKRETVDNIHKAVNVLNVEKVDTTINSSGSTAVATIGSPFKFKKKTNDTSSLSPSEIKKKLEKQRTIIYFIAVGIYFILDIIAIATYTKIYNENLLNTHNTPYSEYRYLLILIEMLVQLLAFSLFAALLNKKHLSKAIFIVSTAELIVCNHFNINFQGYIDSSTYMQKGYDNVYKTQEIFKEVNSIDEFPTFYRAQNTDIDRGSPNGGLFFSYGGLGTFNSNYAFNAQQFLDFSKIPYTYHNWSMGYHESRSFLDNFLGVKYYLVDETETNLPYGYVSYTDDIYPSSSSETKFDEEELGISYSSKLIKLLKQNKKKLLVNTNYLDLLIPLSSIGNLESNLFRYSSSLENNNEYHLLNNALFYEDDLRKIRKLNGFSSSDVSFSLSGQVKSIFNAGHFTYSLNTEDTYLFKSKPFGDINNISSISICGDNQECYKRYELSNDVTSSSLGNIKATNPYSGLDVPVSKLGIDNSLYPAIKLSEVGSASSSTKFDEFHKDNPSLTADEKKFIKSHRILFGSKLLVDTYNLFNNTSDSITQAESYYVTIAVHNNINAKFYKISDIDNTSLENREASKTSYTVDQIESSSEASEESQSGLRVQEIPVVEHAYKNGNYHYSKGYYLNSKPDFVVIDILDSMGVDSNSYTLSSDLKMQIVPTKYPSDSSDDTSDLYSIQSNIDQIKNNKYEIVERTSDRIVFTTNFEKDKMVLLSLPYDESWTLTMRKKKLVVSDPDNSGSETEDNTSSNTTTTTTTTTSSSNDKEYEIISETEIPLFSANGGMLSYYDDRTNSSEYTYDYVLTYVPKGFSIGKLFTIGGGVAFLALSLFYIRVRLRIENSKPHPLSSLKTIALRKKEEDSFKDNMN